MSASDNPYAAQDAAFLRGLVFPGDDTNAMRIQEYKGCVGIACLKSNLLFAFIVEQIGSGIGKVGVARLLRTAKVYPLPGQAGFMVFWRDLPWRERKEIFKPIPKIDSRYEVENNARRD